MTLEMLSMVVNLCWKRTYLYTSGGCSFTVEGVFLSWGLVGRKSQYRRSGLRDDDQNQLDEPQYP